MSDAEPYTVEVLNRLFAAEGGNLLPRLMEIGVFVSAALAEELEQVQQMIAETAVHQGWLIEAIEDADGAVLPAGVDPGSSNLYYLALPAVLPRVIERLEEIVRLYREALKEPKRLTPKAFEVVSRIAHRHQQYLEQFRQIEARRRECSAGSPAKA